MYKIWNVSVNQNIKKEASWIFVTILCISKKQTQSTMIWLPLCGWKTFWGGKWGWDIRQASYRCGWDNKGVCVCVHTQPVTEPCPLHILPSSPVSFSSHDPLSLQSLRSIILRISTSNTHRKLHIIHLANKSVTEGKLTNNLLSQPWNNIFHLLPWNGSKSWYYPSLATGRK